MSVPAVDCGFPTEYGPCREHVQEGDRCPLHSGAKGIEAARRLADRARLAQAPPEARPGRAATPISDEQVAAVCGTLIHHGVDYVVVGGIAAQLHGAPVERTRDVDVVPGRTADNLDRLAAALEAMNARLWVGEHTPEGVAIPFAETFKCPFESSCFRGRLLLARLRRPRHAAVRQRHLLERQDHAQPGS